MPNKKLYSTIYTEAYTEQNLIRKYGYKKKDLEDQLIRDNWFNCDNCNFYYDANHSALAQINQLTGKEEIVCHNCTN